MAKASGNTAMIKIKLVRSLIGHPDNQRRTVTALGLRKMQQEREVPDNAAMRGMIHKVAHLVHIIG